MGFDVENFGIGLAAGWASAYAVYRLRRQISNTVRATRQQATSVQNYTTRSADGRYINDLIELAQTTHLAGSSVPLTEVLVEPRFYALEELAAPSEEEVVLDVFHIVPQVPDHPYLEAVYNRETLSIDDLATGSRMLALLGLPGSGRTTALLTIALHSLGQARFPGFEDVMQRILDEEEAALTDKERAERREDRRRIVQLARDELREQHGITYGLEAYETFDFKQLLPVYVHLANINISADEFGEQIDPAEPLVRAVQSQVGPITARTLPLNLYKRLKQGEALLLLDGLDELPSDEQKEKIIWLRALAEKYDENFLVVATTPYGYGPLADIGLTPVGLQPWNDLTIEQVVKRWTAAWPVIGGTRRRPAERPAEVTVNRAGMNNRALSPVDLILNLWTTFADDADAARQEGSLRAFISRHLPAKQTLDELLPQLTLIAALQLDEGFITLERVESLLSSEDVGTSDDDDEPEAAVEEKPKRGRQAKPAADDRSAQNKFLNRLRRSGLLVAFRNNRYQFRHSFIAAYLGSLTLKTAPPDMMVAKAKSALWSQALAYAALHTSVEPLVKARMNAPLAITHNSVFEVARWLQYADSGVAWRGPLLKQIGNMLIAPNQYPLLRERAAAALIGTRDRNTLFVFRQAARNPNPDVRRLACLGMGAVGHPDAIQDLVPLLQDQVDEVQLAAAMGLAVIQSEEALEALVHSLTEGSEIVRQAVAESLAVLPEEGHPVLYDALAHEDMLVRRAATFGLRRVGTRWAIDSLYVAFIEDSQWYVRSAAQQAFFNLQQGENRGPQPYPDIDAIPWLGEWAGERGENVPAGAAAVHVLETALHDGEPEIRVLAARALGQLGQVGSLKALYTALRDRQEEVRAAAHRSLGDLEMQVGQSLPTPV